MKLNISSVLVRVRENTVSGSNLSTRLKTLGDPNCPCCSGAGYLRFDVPIGHKKFGKVESCICRAKDVALSKRKRLLAFSNLERLVNSNFENFNSAGSEKTQFIAPQEREKLLQAFEICKEFTLLLNGWLLLEVGYGCGKTHLAAAYFNPRAAVSLGYEGE